MKTNKYYIAAGLLCCFMNNVAVGGIIDDAWKSIKQAWNYGNPDQHLYRAIRAKDKDEVEEAIKRGADVNKKYDPYKYETQEQQNKHRGILTFEKEVTPLIVAARYGNKEIVETLIKHGADVNLAGVRHGSKRGGSPYTALYAANYVQNKDVADLLKKNGATESKEDVKDLPKIQSKE